MADFLLMLKEDKDKILKGESVERKLLQTRTIGTDKRSKFMGLISTCFDDTLFDDNATNATMQMSFQPKNLTGIDVSIGSFPDVSGIPDVPDFPSFLGRRLQSGPPPNGNGGGGVVPSDLSGSTPPSQPLGHRSFGRRGITTHFSGVASLSDEEC